MTQTVVFVANRGYALTSSRTSLIKRFLASGWNVVIATADDAESRELCKLGVKLEPVSFNRGGVAFVRDVTAFSVLRRIYEKWQPALIHHFHAKPVILGTLVARRTLGRSVRVVNTITGLGHAFITGGIAAKLAGFGYGKALPQSDMTIFQNHDDHALFLQRNWLNENGAKVIASSGVDTERFSFIDRSQRNGVAPIVVMLGRLLRQKGIPEFAEVAGRIRKHVPEARFVLAGEEDLVHPDSVSADWVRAQEGVEFLGRLNDVVPLLEQADVLLFPSHREGVPRAVLEAAAMGLPTVGYDVPGVREAVIDEETGYLVASLSIDELYEHVLTLLQDKFLRLSMGKAARKLVEDAFDRRVIEEMYMATYRELGIEVE